MEPGKRVIPLLLLLAPGLLLVALGVGSVPLGWDALWGVVNGSAPPMERLLVLELRLPRALGALATGGLLALAGALMQVLLLNPLAEPYVLGVSGGAAMGALGAMLLGLAGAWVPGAAFLGALCSMLLVFGLARGPGGWTPTRLLLTGVVMASGWGAGVGFLLAIAPEQGVKGMLFWLMGDLSPGFPPLAPLAALGVGLAVVWPLARPLNLLARGPEQAAALGVAVLPLRGALFLVASLLTAMAVSSAGSVGFVGLVVPHMLRLAGVVNHRALLPAAALGGGVLLLAADIVARTVLSPRELPVGVVTALVGVPLFLHLLRRGRV